MTQIEAKEGVDYVVMGDSLLLPPPHLLDPSDEQREKILIIKHLDTMSVAILGEWELIGGISRKSFGRFSSAEAALKAKSKLERPARSGIGQYILGGCLVVIVIALATSVFAGPLKTIDTGVYVEMVGVDVGYVIEYHNDLSYTGDPAPMTLSLDGVEVGVSFHLTSGDEPDHMNVVPPVGWYCDPCAISVKERELGQVFIYPQGMM